MTDLAVIRTRLRNATIQMRNRKSDKIVDEVTALLNALDTKDAEIERLSESHRNVMDMLAQVIAERDAAREANETLEAQRYRLEVALKELGWPGYADPSHGDPIEYAQHYRDITRLQALEWQSIETVPTGELVLLGRAPFGPHRLTWRVGVGTYSIVPGSGRLLWDWQYGGDPTHWMPLPSPPPADDPGKEG